MGCWAACPPDGSGDLAPQPMSLDKQQSLPLLLLPGGCAGQQGRRPDRALEQGMAARRSASGQGCLLQQHAAPAAAARSAGRSLRLACWNGASAAAAAAAALAAAAAAAALAAAAGPQAAAAVSASSGPPAAAAAPAQPAAPGSPHCAGPCAARAQPDKLMAQFDAAPAAAAAQTRPCCQGSCSGQRQR